MAHSKPLRDELNAHALATISRNAHRREYAYRGAQFDGVNINDFGARHDDKTFYVRDLGCDKYRSP